MKHISLDSKIKQWNRKLSSRFAKKSGSLLFETPYIDLVPAERFNGSEEAIIACFCFHDLIRTKEQNAVITDWLDYLSSGFPELERYPDSINENETEYVLMRMPLD